MAPLTSSPVLVTPVPDQGDPSNLMSTVCFHVQVDQCVSWDPKFYPQNELLLLETHVQGEEWGGGR